MTEVTITFHLLEEVTPQLYASKVALACSKQGTLREGEFVTVEPNTDPGMSGLANKFELIEFIETDLGGILKEKIEYPNIEPSRV